MAYLSHIFTQYGVKVDSGKVEAIERWPTPVTVRALRGLLELPGYYRKFIKDFGIIAASLTRLLRKNAFVWTEKTSHSFDTLKKAMTSTPILALPNFSEPFAVECDASEVGLGAALHQHGQQIVFYSHALAQQHHKLPSYEKKLSGLVKELFDIKGFIFGVIISSFVLIIIA